MSQTHIQKLAELFVRHNAHKQLGIHLVHGHFKTAPNTVMLGTNIENFCGRWTKTTATDMIELNKIYGHIFALRPPVGFVAYEYQDGPMPDLSAISDNFFAELASYLTSNDLISLLGFQVRLEGVPENMFEFIFDQGTVMLKKLLEIIKYLTLANFSRNSPASLTSRKLLSEQRFSFDGLSLSNFSKTRKVMNGHAATQRAKMFWKKFI